MTYKVGDIVKYKVAGLDRVLDRKLGGHIGIILSINEREANNIANGDVGDSYPGYPYFFMSLKTFHRETLAEEEIEHL